MFTFRLSLNPGSCENSFKVQSKLIDMSIQDNAVIKHISLICVSHHENMPI